MKQKKVLVVIPYFIPAYSYGGPVKVAYDYAIKLVERGYDVTVITTDALDKDDRIKNLEETIDGIKIIRFRNFSNYLAKFHNIYLPLGITKRVKNNIKNYDVVHMHDFFTYLNIVIGKYCRKYNIPYIVQPHGSANFLPERGKSFIKKIFFKLFGTKLFEGSKLIIAVSQYEKNNIYYSHKDRIEIIYNGIDTKVIKEFEKSITKKDIEEFKGKYGLYGKKIIFSMGRLHSVKRFDKLIEWSKDILFKNDDYCVVISGPDEGEMGKLQSMIKENGLDGKVILTGGLYGKDKYIAYGIANLFTLLSDSEAGAVTVTDAIYYNLPLILSKGCNFEFENEYVRVIEDKKDFEKAVNDFIDKKAKYSFGKEFDMDYLITKLEGLYEKKNNKINKDNIYFSFDDGYSKDLEFAKELKKRGFNNLMFYVPIKNCEGKGTLTEKEILELSELGEIGGHTYNHVDLMTLSLEEAEKEIKQGKESLERVLGKRIISFCYPRGHFNKSVIELVKKLGFKQTRSARLFNFHKMNKGEFVEHPNIHFYPHSLLIDCLHCVKWLDFYSLFWRLRYFYLSHYEMIIKILEKNGSIHIWGHTWEIDKKEFDKILDILDTQNN